MRHFCVFDFETDSANPENANPVEIACKMVDPYTLEPIVGSEFSNFARPEGIDDLQTYLIEDRLKTIKWHCDLHKCSQEQLLDKWRAYPTINVVWDLFHKHIKKYNRDNTQWEAPVPCGMNIRNFDLVIAKRFNTKFDIKIMFNHEVVDIRDLGFYWLQWDTSLRSRSFDNLRKYFGLEGTNAHTALADVNEELVIVCKFLKMHKHLYSKITFKNSCLPKQEAIVN